MARGEKVTETVVGGSRIPGDPFPPGTGGASARFFSGTLQEAASFPLGKGTAKGCSLVEIMHAVSVFGWGFKILPFQSQQGAAGCERWALVSGKQYEVLGWTIISKSLLGWRKYEPNQQPPPS